MNALSRAVIVPSLMLLTAGFAQAADSKDFHRTVPLDHDGRVLIDTFKGSVNVATWDRPEVSIEARIEPDGDDRDQKEKIDLTEIRVSGSGSSVSIKSDYDAIQRHHFFGLFWGDNGTMPFVHYTIRMPATARLDIEDYKSDIKVSDLKNDLKLKTYKGTARVTGLDGAARLETYKGDARVEFARYSHASRFETYKGQIEVSLPKDSHFSLEADAGRHGDLETDFPMTTRAGRSRSGRFSGSVNGGGSELTLTTYKGTLRVRAS